MQDPRIKLVILGLVFLLSTVFFWSMTNRFLYPSRAGSQPVSVFFDKKQALASKSGEVQINVFLAAGSSQTLSASSLAIQYPSDKVSFVKKEETFVSKSCSANNFAFEKQVKVVNEPDKNKVVISRLTMKNNKELSKGLMCWGSLVFQFREDVKEAVVTLIDDPAVEIIGPENIYSAKYGDGATITMKASDGTSITGSVSATPILSPPSCQTKSRGDVDCSGKCDLRDFEVFRREKVGKVLTKTADVNSDGKVDLIDFNIWKRCYFGGILQGRKKITPTSVLHSRKQLSVPVKDIVGTVFQKDVLIDSTSPTGFIMPTNYRFYPEEGQDELIKEAGIDTVKEIDLMPYSKLGSQVNNRKVKISGLFIKNYGDYIFPRPFRIGWPNGQVILITNIEIVANPTITQQP